MTGLAQHIDRIDSMETMELSGSVVSVEGLSVHVDHLPVPVGGLVRFEQRGHQLHQDQIVPRGEVIGFKQGTSIVMLFGESTGISPGTRVTGEQSAQTVQVGEGLLGRVINGLGRPIDGKGPVLNTRPRLLMPDPTTALRRRRIQQPLPTGIRAIDAMVPIGKGQRVGVFSGPGVGKSTLLSSIARNTSADVNVIGLIGERGREVRDFLEDSLGAEGLARSVVVVSTGDESPLMRARAAFLSCSVAEHFRDQHQDVLLIMDSITRFAQAQRQIGLTAGEHPATRGYTPSVFALLPRLLERAGTLELGGSITGLYAVLVEGDDLAEPIADAARGILDGHLVLSRSLAARGHHPAIDMQESISRVADDICGLPHQAARRRLGGLLASYRSAEELISIGAYAAGSDPECDCAISMMPQLDGFLRQPVQEKAAYPETCKRVVELAACSQAQSGKPVHSTAGGPVASTQVSNSPSSRITAT